MKRVAWALLAALMTLAPAASRAEYPERPVKIIVPFQAGGASDVAARAIADGLARRTGQPFVVENRAGATGLVGTQAAATAAPDGYTLLMGHVDTLVLNPLLRRKLPYDATKKFEPIAFISRVPGVLIARPGSGIDGGESLIAAAKARPNRVSLGTWGVGSTVHMGLELMNQIAGIELMHVPFQSAAAAVAGVLSGQVDLTWVTPEFASGLAREGKAVVVGASSAARISRVPDVRTLSEQGFTGFDVDTWYGLVAPPGTPLALRQKLHGLVNALLQEPEVAQKLRQAGHETQPMSVQDFDALVAREWHKWQDVIRTRKLALQLD